MGVCLGYTFVKSMIYSGDYCLHDNEWRSSVQCKVLGCLYSVSIHGSLYTVAVLSVTKLYRRVFDGVLSLKFLCLITVLIFIFAVSHSVLPNLPLTSIQDLLRTSMVFSDNPFISHFNLTVLSRMYTVYNGPQPIPDTYTLLSQLNNISSKPGIFTPIELGFYSYSPLCVPNMYLFQASIYWYQVIYMVIITTLLAPVTLSFIYVNCYKLNETIEVQANTDKKDSPDFKLIIIIGLKLMTWITILSLMAVNAVFNHLITSDLLYQITVIVVFPLGCFINPLYSSSIYKRVGSVLQKQFYDRLKSKRNTPTVPKELEMPVTVGSLEMPVTVGSLELDVGCE